MVVENQASHTIKQTRCCFVCGQHRTEWMMILNEAICLSCEHEMVQLNVNDPQYGYYLWQLRKLYQPFVV